MGLPKRPPFLLRVVACQVKVPTQVAKSAFTIQTSPMKINTTTYVVSVPFPNCRQNPPPSPPLPPEQMNTIFLSPLLFHSSQVLLWVSFSLSRDWEPPSVWVIFSWLQILNSGIFLITHSLLAFWYSNKSLFKALLNDALAKEKMEYFLNITT